MAPVEAEAREPDQEEGQSDDSKEESYSASKDENLSLKFGTIHGEDIGGDDGPRAAPNPAESGGTCNPKVTKQPRVVLLADEITHSVVVGSAAGGGRHGASWFQPGPRATIADVESFAISRVLHLHTENSGMSWFAAAHATDGKYAKFL